MDPQNKKLLLNLARKTLETHFQNKKFYLTEIPPEFQQKGGVFVTLHKERELRGCIGYIFPVKSIYEGVKENVLNAAFQDPRFYPLKKEELPELKIEISILTPPQKLAFLFPEELLKKLTKKEGVILEKNSRQSTFLPQVWEQLPEKVGFLEHLSLKAGLSKDAWKTANIFIYFAEAFSED